MFSKKFPWASSRSSQSPDASQDHQQNAGNSSNSGSRNANKMDSSSQVAEDETSLTTILPSSEDRAALLLLTAKCTDSMSKTITDVFDPDQSDNPPKLPPRPSLAGPSTTEKTPEETRKEAQDDEERERKERQRRVKELSAPQMQELKAAALDYFEEWRSKVFTRVGEALNEKPPTSSSSPDSPTQLSHIETTVQEPQSHTAATTYIDELSQEDKDSVTALHQLYPPVTTPLKELSQPKRVIILHSLLLLLLSLERYPSESRLLLLQIASSLHLPTSTLTEDESKVARGLLEAAKQHLSADEETKRKQDDNAFSRKWKVGLGAVAGATLIGVTGGLAAPLLAAGVGTVMGGLGLGTTAVATYLGALAGSAPLVGILFGAYGGRMTGKMVDEYAKQVSDFAFIPIRKGNLFKDDKDLRRLRVAIGISGWLTKQDDIVRPWHVISSSTEAFALRWELEALMNLGNALTTYVKSAAWGVAKSEIIKRTVFGALSAGLWPLALVKVSRIVDNPFSVARSRAEKAGTVLADALINKVQGERPVTLVGYSLGARTIYACLNSLAERHAFGLVESAVLLGAPTPSDSVAWRRMRSVVAGRLINVYSSNDYLLGFLYRTSSLQYGIAGLQPVRDVVGVENVDVSAIVDGHQKYRLLSGPILKKIGFEDVDPAEVEKQERALKQEERKDEEERTRKQNQGHEENEAELEQEVEKKNKEGMMGWVTNKLSVVGIGSGNDSNPKDDATRHVDETTTDSQPHTEKEQHSIQMVDTEHDQQNSIPPTTNEDATQKSQNQDQQQDTQFNTNTGPAPKDQGEDQNALEKAASAAEKVLVPGPT